jgi:hypothetical protein
MDASKDKKEAPKGIIQSKNATFVHQSISSSNNFKFLYCIILYLSRTVFSTFTTGDIDLLLPFSCILVIKKGNTIDKTGALNENLRNSRQHR